MDSETARSLETIEACLGLRARTRIEMYFRRGLFDKEFIMRMRTSCDNQLLRSVWIA